MPFETAKEYDFPASLTNFADALPIRSRQIAVCLAKSLKRHGLLFDGCPLRFFFFLNEAPKIAMATWQDPNIC